MRLNIIIKSTKPTKILRSKEIGQKTLPKVTRLVIRMELNPITKTRMKLNPITKIRMKLNPITKTRMKLNPITTKRMSQTKKLRSKDKETGAKETSLKET